MGLGVVYNVFLSLAYLYLYICQLPYLCGYL